MGFVRLFLGLVVREHAIKLWPYLREDLPYRVCHFQSSMVPGLALIIILSLVSARLLSPCAHISNLSSCDEIQRACSSSNSTSPRWLTHCSSIFALVLKDLRVCLRSFMAKVCRSHPRKRSRSHRISQSAACLRSDG